MFARTDRLLLRPIWAEDAPSLRQLGLAIPDLIQSRIDMPDLLVLSRTDAHPKPVGRASLARTRGGTTALRLWITPEARGHGHATEAGRAVIDMAQHCLGLSALTACPAPDDAAALRLCARLGFGMGQGAGAQLALPLKNDKKIAKFCLAA